MSEDLLPHPVTGALFPSPVPPGTGWPDDPADAATPVAHDADDVRTVAGSVRPRARSTRPCQRLPGLRPAGALARGRRRAQARVVRRPSPTGAARSPAGATRARRAHRRSRPGGQRRQPHRPDLHRRPFRRLALRLAAPGRPRHRRRPRSTPATGSGWSAPGWSPRSAARPRTTSRPSRSATPARPGCVREVELVVPSVRVVVCLGSFGWDAALRTLPRRSGTTSRGRGPASATPPRRRSTVARGAGARPLLGSYHPSQQNTFTGKLTEPMLDAVLGRVAAAARARGAGRMIRVTLQAITVIGHDRPGIIAETTARARRPRAQPRGLHDDPAARSLRDDADLRGRRARPPRSRTALAGLTADGSLTVAVREVPEEPEQARRSARRTCSPCTAATGPASSRRVAAEVARVGGNITDLTTRLAGEPVPPRSPRSTCPPAPTSTRSSSRSRRVGAEPRRRGHPARGGERRPVTDGELAGATGRRRRRPLDRGRPRRRGARARRGAARRPACCRRRRDGRPDRAGDRCSSPPTWSPPCGSRPGCVGLAAPQVGVGAKVFCVDVSEHPKTRGHHGTFVLCNAVVVESSRNEKAREGCM